MHVSDREAQFRDFVAGRMESLRGLAYLTCGDWQVAEDAVLSALARLYAKWNRVENHDAYARTAVVRAAIDEALLAKEEGRERTILFGLSGHGHFDLAAYDAYLSGQLEDYELPEEMITRALAELTRLGTALGGRPSTFAGLAGMGDLIATCISSNSRNHRVGFGMARGMTLDAIVAEMAMVAEGIKTTRAVLDLAERDAGGACGRTTLSLRADKVLARRCRYP